MQNHFHHNIKTFLSVSSVLTVTLSVQAQVVTGTAPVRQHRSEQGPPDRRAVAAPATVHPQGGSCTQTCTWGISEIVNSAKL